MKFKTLVIGLGKIGMMYNLSNAKNNYSNHCDVFNNDKNFILSGGVDVNNKKRNIFYKKFNKPTFSNLDEALLLLQPDIIVISVPTVNFEFFFRKFYSLNIKPKLFILEKPGGLNAKKLNFFFKYCKKNKINLIMNYTRNFSTKLNNVSSVLKKKKIGSLKNIQIFYKKGILNSCSHYLSFINNFINLKNFDFIKVKNIFKKDKDFYGNVTISCGIKINLNLVEKRNEKICIEGTKGKLIYITEKHQVYFRSSNKTSMITCDFEKDLKNMINFVKKNINSRKKCYKLFEKNIFILQLLQKICPKI